MIKTDIYKLSYNFSLRIIQLYTQLIQNKEYIIEATFKECHKHRSKHL
jgi:hypothetical protein